MVINEDVKAVVEGSAFLSLVTMGSDGMPHPIVAGKGEVEGDSIVIGIYKMEATQKNIASNKSAWVVAATGAPKGYRLTGTAEAKEGKLIFTPSLAEALL